MLCSGASDSCFQLSTTARNFSEARADCRQQRGDLVVYRAAAKQLQVEAYFAKTGALPATAYWLGMQAASAGSFAYVDGGPVPLAASNRPYVHWGYTAPAAAAAQAALRCVAARASLAYDFYLGDASAGQQGQLQSYQTSGTADKKWVSCYMITCTKQLAMSSRSLLLAAFRHQCLFPIAPTCCLLPAAC